MCDILFLYQKGEIQTSYIHIFIVFGAIEKFVVLKFEIYEVT